MLLYKYRQVTGKQRRNKMNYTKHDIYNLRQDIAGYYGEFYVSLDWRQSHVTIWYRDNIISLGDPDNYPNYLSASNKNVLKRLCRNYISVDSVSDDGETIFQTFKGNKFMRKIGAY